jgi:spoIIIJ-associated protein
LATKKLDPVKEITALTDDFTADLGVRAEVSVSRDLEDPENGYLVSLTGEDLGALIGYHGETLNALQLLLSLIVSHKLGEWVRVTLDAGDWRLRRFETLQAMAERAAERAIATGEEVALPVMSSSDRRLVHLALKDHSSVLSESTGEEGYRRVVIRPKS